MSSFKTTLFKAVQIADIVETWDNLTEHEGWCRCYQPEELLFIEVRYYSPMILRNRFFYFKDQEIRIIDGVAQVSGWRRHDEADRRDDTASDMDDFVVIRLKFSTQTNPKLLEMEDIERGTRNSVSLGRYTDGFDPQDIAEARFRSHGLHLIKN